MSIIILMQGKFTVEFSISNTDILWISILAIVCTAYAFVVSIAVMRHLTPFSLMLAINMEPVYGIMFGVLIFGSDEKMSHILHWHSTHIIVCIDKWIFEVKNENEFIHQLNQNIIFV